MRQPPAAILGAFALTSFACSTTASPQADVDASSVVGVDAGAGEPEVDAADDATTAHPSVDAGAGDAFSVGAHTPYPQVPDQGGPRVQHPQLVTVTFAGDTRVSTLEAFATWIVGSNWLTSVGKEYGVGSGSVAGVAHRPETPPTAMTSGDIEAFLAAGVADGSIPRPSALSDAVYLIYYPSATHITTTFVNGIIKKSCTDFGGYHGEVHQSGLDFAYIAMPNCGGAVAGLTALETIEFIASHEVIEAATDPMPITKPAWQLVPDPASAWFTTFQFEVEVGDMCEAPSRWVREGGFVATRSWSNAAAAAGGEPCVPFDAKAPVFGVTVTPEGVLSGAPGATVDVTLHGWSTAPVANWTVIAELLGAFDPAVTFSKKTMSNGGTATMQIKIPATAQSGTSTGVLIVSSHTSADATMWPVAVTVP